MRFCLTDIHPQRKIYKEREREISRDNLDIYSSIYFDRISSCISRKKSELLRTRARIRRNDSRYFDSTDTEGSAGGGGLKRTCPGPVYIRVNGARIPPTVTPESFNPP